jgi:hypothetical protein
MFGVEKGLIKKTEKVGAVGFLRMVKELLDGPLKVMWFSTFLRAESSVKVPESPVKLIICGAPAVAVPSLLAARIAALREPGPPSTSVFTLKTVAPAVLGLRSKAEKANAHKKQEITLLRMNFSLAIHFRLKFIIC